MVSRVVRKAALLAAGLSIVVAACGPGSSGKPGATPPGTGAPASSSQAPATAAQGSLQPPAASGMEQAVYFLTEDSSGTKPSSGTQIELMFEPDGRATLYAVSSTDELSHHGTWQYEDGRLSLKFTAEDFKPDATFQLSLADNTVTMPFQVFGAGAGTSTWKRGSLSVVPKTLAVFAADAADQDGGTTPDQALDEAVGVAQAMIDSGDPNVDVVPVASTGQFRLTSARRTSTDAGLSVGSPSPNIDSVTKLQDGLHIEYENGPAIDVALAGWTAEPSDATALTVGPIASDPRVRLDPARPNSATDDPANKRAVFIVPFASRKYVGRNWTMLLPNKTLSWAGVQSGLIKATGGFAWNTEAAKLKKVGYDVSTAFDADASLSKIIELLGGKSSSAPGLVVFNTHGDSNGELATGVDLGPTNDLAGAEAKLAAALADVSVTYPDLATFEGGTAADPKTVALFAVERSDDPRAGEFFLGITPAFWRWLGSHGAKFNRSLVYIAACSTDASPDLRNAVDAGAYFGWASDINSMLAGAVGNYIIDSMIRPTHTAEEAYYNIFRIVSTRQRIYDEDQDFEDAISSGFAKSTGFLDLLHGYGWDKSALVPYATSGWLDREMNPGNVWWLVFAARWDQHAADGADTLVKCEMTYWQAGEEAGLRDTFCNSAAPGGVPTSDEVGYATFVLTGKQLVPYSGTPVPRLTLDDGGV
jgi:hypothetical protein